MTIGLLMKTYTTHNTKLVQEEGWSTTDKKPTVVINFISKLFREHNQLREALECLGDWNPKLEYWERPETVARFEADMEKARKILEETE